MDYRQNRNYIRSATYSFITLLFLVTNAFAVTSPDVVVDYENDSLAVLNDNFRKLRKGIESAESSISSINTVPAGVIVMWSGAITAIPSGWAICDGNNGTPNLTDRFIIHADADAGGTNDVGDTGGANEVDLGHTHTVANHAHDIATTGTTDAGAGNEGVVVSSGKLRVKTTGGGVQLPYADDNTKTDGTSETDSELSATQDNRPAFYALAFIQKL